MYLLQVEQLFILKNQSLNLTIEYWFQLRNGFILCICLETCNSASLEMYFIYDLYYSFPIDDFKKRVANLTEKFFEKCS
jgi:hypothetical protein